MRVQPTSVLRENMSTDGSLYPHHNFCTLIKADFDGFLRRPLRRYDCAQSH